MKRRAREYIVVAPLLLAALAAIAAGVIGPAHRAPADPTAPARRPATAAGSAGEGAVRLTDLHDPWGRAYYYRCPGIHNPAGYDLWSAGPDNVSGTRDDITNWPPE